MIITVVFCNQSSFKVSLLKDVFAQLSCDIW